MRKLGIFILGATLAFGIIFGYNNEITAKAEEKSVYIGGMTAGFTLKTGGAQIIGTCEVISEQKTCSPAQNVGLRAGDTITKVGGIEIESIQELNEIVNKCKGNALEFEVCRGNETFTVEIEPLKDGNTGRYKIGVLVRDSVSGIGTVTYIDKETGRFGSLGHTVMGENKRQMQISDGYVYECSIVGVTKGIRGRAGELRGLFLNDKQLGNAEKLCNCGIFGQIKENFDTTELISTVANSSKAKPGEAYIYSTVNGVCPKKYEIEIVKVDKNNRENKNYVIKITDDALIGETGGIVQGMSGSPIVQDGKLVGAVTHVFLNDPTRGYGINIETMLQE